MARKKQKKSNIFQGAEVTIASSAELYGEGSSSVSRKTGNW